MKVYAYLRVSTQHQDNEKFKHDLINYCYQHFNCEPLVVEEIVSGTVKSEERELNDLLNRMQAGDKLVTPEISRLSRSIYDIWKIAEIAHENDFEIHIIKQNMIIRNDALSIVHLSVLAAFAQIEREQISERTKEALRDAKRRGVVLGRPKHSKSSKFDAVNCKELAYRYSNVKEIYEHLRDLEGIDCSYHSVYQYLKRRNLLSIVKSKSLFN